MWVQALTWGSWAYSIFPGRSTELYGGRFSVRGVAGGQRQSGQRRLALWVKPQLLSKFAGRSRLVTLLQKYRPHRDVRTRARGIHRQRLPGGSFGGLQAFSVQLDAGQVKPHVIARLQAQRLREIARCVFIIAPFPGHASQREERGAVARLHFQRPLQQRKRVLIAALSDVGRAQRNQRFGIVRRNDDSARE